MLDTMIGGYTLLDVNIETGRTHQIRVHLAAIGYPVAGDGVYGIKVKFLERQFLHAWRLGFTHPVTGEALEFEAPPPADFQQLLATLRQQIKNLKSKI